ncbi:MAG: TIGR01777 family oxidoreductase [Verrucomicrobiota bacterium]
MPKFKRSAVLACSPSALSQWHYRPGAFTRLSPPWESVRELEPTHPILLGREPLLEIQAGPLKRKWQVAYPKATPEEFIDSQTSGPFAHWEHRHRFLEEKEGSLLEDEIDYRLPLAPLSQWFAGRFVQNKLERMFRYRHEVTRLDLETLPPTPRPLHVLLTGASGMIGRALKALLQTQGHQVTGLTRSPKEADEIGWNPAQGQLDLSSLLPLDAVVHLAGANVSAQRWTPGYRKLILESRTVATQLLAERLAALPSPPAVFLSASGANFYPLDGQPHTEEGPQGDSFLAQVVGEWEAASQAVESFARRALFRLGVVLSPGGGALRKLLPLFQLGLGGPVGHGRQYLPWISIDDAVLLLYHALLDARYQGPLNAVAPDMQTSRGFGQVLGKVLRRPALLPAPAFALKAVFGQMAEETLLGSVQARPARLQELQFPFRYPKLEPALHHLLGRAARP